MQSWIILFRTDAEKVDLVRVQIRDPVLSLFLSYRLLSGATAKHADVLVKMMMSQVQGGRLYTREAGIVVIFDDWLLAQVLSLFAALHPYEMCLRSSVWHLFYKQKNDPL